MVRPVAGSRSMLRLKIILAVLTVFFLGIVMQARADITSDPSNISITATVAGTAPAVPSAPSVQIGGFAAPNASIVVTRDGTKIATGKANADGSFTITLNDQPTGTQVYVLSFTDENGRALGPLTFSFNLTNGTNTVVSGAFPGPSIGIDKTSVKIGQPVTVVGTTLPHSVVTTSVHSGTVQNYTATANAAGDWSQVVQTSQLEAGTHVAKAQALTPGNTISGYSQEIEFAVNPLAKCDGKKTADLNCDNHVDLTDFSILLYFWNTTNPTNARADINGDGTVNLTDFSIMLYQWTA